MHFHLPTSAGTALLVLALLLIPRSDATAADGSFVCRGQRRVCNMIVAAERNLTAMLVTSDPAAVQRYLAEDAVWSLSDGRRWTKHEGIAAIRNERRMESSQLVRADVHQFGAVAIVLWDERWKKASEEREGRAVGTDTWMLRNGRWQIIASQEARPVPTPAT